MAATPYVIEEYVRWSDVDFAGIIFYGSYVRFFEIAETELFRACGLAYARVFDQYNIFLPRKVVHSEFYWPARLDDRLRVAAYVGRVGTKSMTLNFDVLRHGVTALGAAGWMVLVCVDRKSLKPESLPEGLVRALAPHTLTPAAARAQLGVPPPPPPPPSSPPSPPPDVRRAP
jgi:acyl-CoA thioester hydrolase